MDSALVVPRRLSDGQALGGTPESAAWTFAFSACVDTAEPRQIASFWEAALGWRRTSDEDYGVCIEPPKGSPEDGVAPDILFLKVPEGN